MKKFSRILSVIAAVGIIAASVAGCRTTPETVDEGNEGSSKLVMATNAEFPPFEYITEKGKGLVGEYDGIDIAIAMEIAKDLGKELEVSNMIFDSIVPSVKSGKADIGIAGMTIKPDRLENVDFSEPYAIAYQTIVVLKDNTDITSVDSLKGKTVGVVTGYTGDMALEEVSKEKNITIQRYQKGIDAIMDLKNGRIDAVVIDSPTAKAFIDKNKDIKGIDDESFFEKEEYAVAVKKGDKDMLEKVNKTIARLKASGAIDKIASEVNERLSK